MVKTTKERHRTHTPYAKKKGKCNQRRTHFACSIVSRDIFVFNWQKLQGISLKNESFIDKWFANRTVCVSFFSFLFFFFFFFFFCWSGIFSAHHFANNWNCLTWISGNVEMISRPTLPDRRIEPETVWIPGERASDQAAEPRAFLQSTCP